MKIFHFVNKINNDVNYKIRTNFHRISQLYAHQVMHKFLTHRRKVVIKDEVVNELPTNLRN